MSRPGLSIVTTLYRSSDTIEAFCRRSLAAADTLFDDVELVVVNDGSPDDSLDKTLALQALDPRIVAVDLSRNHGHHKAIMVGLAHARGDLVFLIDSDLEEDPELLAPFLDRLRQEPCDVVYGVQEARRGGLVERATGAAFYHVIDALSDVRLPRNLLTVRLMTRDFVTALTRHRDREFAVAQLWWITGFRQTPMVVAKHAHSPTTYSIARRLNMALRFVTTTSTRLLHLIFWSGLAIAGLAALVTLYYLARYMMFGVAVSGFTSLIVSIWFFGGTTTLILGILGIYMANIMSETKRRPYAVIRKVHRVAPLAAQAGREPPVALRR